MHRQSPPQLWYMNLRSLSIVVYVRFSPHITIRLQRSEANARRRMITGGPRQSQMVTGVHEVMPKRTSVFDHDHVLLTGINSQQTQRLFA